MHGAARLLSAYASAFSSGAANRVRLRTGELRTTGHTRARGRAREAKRSLTAAAGESPPVSRSGGQATVVLASLLRFNVSCVRVGARFAVLPAWDDVSTFRRFGWGGLPATSLAAHARSSSCLQALSGGSIERRHVAQIKAQEGLHRGLGIGKTT